MASLLGLTVQQPHSWLKEDEAASWNGRRRSLGMPGGGSMRKQAASCSLLQSAIPTSHLRLLSPGAHATLLLHLRHLLAQTLLELSHLKLPHI